MSDSRLIVANNVAFRQGNREILSNAHLTISRNEVVTLIGPNGAGKSTLVKILLGLLKPSSGEVNRANGLTIGYMPQKLTIDSSLPLTVKRFVGLTGDSAGKVLTSLQRTGVQNLAEQSIHLLSGGELQRVLLARALISSPDLLVLDEPVQGVDVSGQSALYRLIGDVKAETGCGVLMISHDLHLVMAETDRVVCLNQHICCEGHPDLISSDPEFLRLFGETEDSRVALYTHDHDHTHDHVHGDTCTVKNRDSHA